MTMQNMRKFQRSTSLTKRKFLNNKNDTAIRPTSLFYLSIPVPCPSPPPLPLHLLSNPFLLPRESGLNTIIKIKKKNVGKISKQENE